MDNMMVVNGKQVTALTLVKIGEKSKARIFLSSGNFIDYLPESEEILSGILQDIDDGKMFRLNGDVQICKI
jgi:hypothetical protein